MVLASVERVVKLDVELDQDKIVLIDQGFGHGLNRSGEIVLISCNDCSSCRGCGGVGR
jgi:hypothetical protein